MTEISVFDYQIVQVAYFEDDANLPRGGDFASIWLGFDMLKKHRVSGFFRRLDDKAKIKLRRLRLGDPTAIDALINEPNVIFVGGCAEACKTGPFRHYHQFNLDLDRASRCVFGPTPPSFTFTLCNSWMTDLIGVPTFLKVLQRNFEILDRSRPFYGFVDLDRVEDIYNGYMYGSMSIMNAPLNRFSDQAPWLRSVSMKRHQARSIYWGNYFGNVILDKVGGRESFLSYCREKTTSRYGTPTILIWEFTNGVFVSLSDSFSDCTPGGIVSTLIPRNIKWLYERLAEGNAIIGA